MVLRKPSAKNPIDEPSGAKNGCVAPMLPVTSVASNRLIGLRYNRVRPSVMAVYASRELSGEIAISRSCRSSGMCNDSAWLVRVWGGGADRKAMARPPTIKPRTKVRLVTKVRFEHYFCFRY